MFKIKLLSALLVGGLFLTSCASTSMYNWGSYENSLYKYYKKPDTLPAHLKNLEKTVTKGESSGNVPPGMYAELGYAYLVSGDSLAAIDYFEKEKQKWPESVILMDMMIANAQKASDAANMDSTAAGGSDE